MERTARLSQRLRELMTERGLNYESLGKILDMKPQTLNRYVLGQREPKAGIASEMAVKLGVDSMWLQGYDVPRESTRLPGETLLPILGKIRAGAPHTAREEVEGWAAADVVRPEECFYLRVSGDSMINAGIREGDLVLIRRGGAPENGQIVACIVEGEEATLKRFTRQGDFVILQPENPAYQPRIVPASDFALGSAVVVGIAQKLVRDL